MGSRPPRQDPSQTDRKSRFQEFGRLERETQVKPALGAIHGRSKNGHQEKPNQHGRTQQNPNAACHVSWQDRSSEHGEQPNKLPAQVQVEKVEIIQLDPRSGKSLRAGWGSRRDGQSAQGHQQQDQPQQYPVDFAPPDRKFAAPVALPRQPRLRRLSGARNERRMRSHQRDPSAAGEPWSVVSA